MLKITLIILLVLIAPVLFLALRAILVGKSTSQAINAVKKNLEMKKDPDSTSEKNKEK